MAIDIVNIIIIREDPPAEPSAGGSVFVGAFCECPRAITDRPYGVFC